MKVFVEFATPESDGYVMTVVNVPDIPDLPEYMNYRYRDMAREKLKDHFGKYITIASWRLCDKIQYIE